MIRLKIGTYDIPDLRLHPNLVNDVKAMYLKFEQGDIDFTTLASVLGHKTARSGTFTAKMATMKTFNLVEGRGKVHVTEAGRKIAQVVSNKKDLNEGLITSVTSIPLWKELYEKYTKVGKDLPTSDFWLDLRQICHVSPEEAQNKAEMIRKAYLEDITDIEPSNGGGSSMDDDMIADQARKASQVVKELSFLTDGGIELRLPKGELREKWEKYKKMIDIYVESA